MAKARFYALFMPAPSSSSRIFMRLALSPPIGARSSKAGVEREAPAFPFCRREPRNAASDQDVRCRLRGKARAAGPDRPAALLAWLRRAARASLWRSFQADANPRSRPIFQLYRTRPDFWTVIRPGGRMEHGFAELGEAVSFIRAESRGMPVTVELRIDDFYAVSYLEPGREGPLFGETR